MGEDLSGDESWGTRNTRIKSKHPSRKKCYSNLSHTCKKGEQRECGVARGWKGVLFSRSALAQ